MNDAVISQQITEMVRRFFGRRRPGPVPWPAQPVPAIAREEPSVSAAPQRAPSAGVLCASKLQLIGLARVKSELGDRWPKLAERVRSVAQTIINKHMSPEDACEANGDDGFLVLFAQLSQAEARFKADAICREIERRLVGCNLTEVADCAAEVVMVDIGAALRESEARPAVNPNGPQRPTARPRSSGGPHAPARGTTFDFEDDVIWQDADPLPPDVPRGRARSPRKPINEQESSDGETASRSGEASVAQEAGKVASTATPSKVPSRQRGGPLNLSQIQWVYRPVWDFQKSALILFALLPQNFDDAHANGADTADLELLGELDAAGVAKAVTDLTQLSKSDKRLPLLVQVHRETLEDPRRRAFLLGTINKVPGQWHKLLILEIVGAAEKAAHQTASLVPALKALPLRTALRVGPLTSDLAGMRSCGAELATLTLPADLPEAAQMKALASIVDRALEAKFECLVWDVRSRSMVLAAASSGIRYLSGGAIAQDLPTLSHAMRYSLADLYRNG